jgi:hypothetical protein
MRTVHRACASRRRTLSAPTASVPMRRGVRPPKSFDQSRQREVARNATAYERHEAWEVVGPRGQPICVLGDWDDREHVGKFHRQAEKCVSNRRQVRLES